MHRDNLLKSPAFHAILLFCLYAVAFMGAYDRFFEGGVSYEFCHYGEIGRNIAQGKGFRTGVVFPATLAFFERKGIGFTPESPEFARFPLYAYAVGASERLFGAGDFQVAWVNGAVVSFASALLYWIVAQSAPAWTGLLASIFLFFCPSILRGFALWGYPDLLFGLLILILNYGVVFGAWPPFALGLLGGAAWAARSNFMLWLPVYGAWIYWKSSGRRGRACALFAAGFLAAAFPYAYYLRSHFGGVVNPNFLWNLANGVLIPDLAWNHYRLFHFSEILPALWQPLLKKGLLGFLDFFRNLPALWQCGFLWGPYFLSLFAPKDRAWRNWQQLYGILLGVQLFFFVFLRQESIGPFVSGRYYLWYAPALMAGAAQGFRDLSVYVNKKTWSALCFLLVLGHAFLWSSYYAKKDPGFGHPSGLPVQNWPEMEFLREEAESGSVVLSNIPAQVGWYAGLRAVQLPYEWEDVPKIEAASRLDYIFVTTLTAGEFGRFPQWQKILISPDERRAFCARFGYAPHRVYPNGLLLKKRNL
ncbi:MAG: hypothetical protein HY611_02210 [Elusimicrobia bacterium]|nr:hypothetical protein [Elusimicrobiota bacterium]